MKISFEEVLLNENFSINDKIFYISGNEETLISKVEKFLIDKFKLSGITEFNRVKNINDFSEEGSLFSDSQVVIINDFKNLEKAKLKNLLNQKKYPIVVVPNLRGDTTIKKIFEKEKDMEIIYCYEVSDRQKTNILNHFIRLHNLELSKDAFWYLIQNTENKYFFFENEINKILNLNKSNCSINEIKSVLSSTVNENYYALLFSILKKNSDLNILYNQTITNISDIYRLLYTSKIFFEIIFSSKNRSELEFAIPRYMFKEKNNFITVYNKINLNNKNNIYNLIFKTETLVRKNSSQYFSIGNRFLLNLKKALKN